MIFLVGGWSRLLSMFFFLPLWNLPIFRTWQSGQNREDICKDYSTMRVFACSHSDFGYLSIFIPVILIFVPSAFSFPIVQYFYRY